MCHCGNMGMEQTPSKSQHTKLTLEKKILPPLRRDSNSQLFSHESGALPTCYPTPTSTPPPHPPIPSPLPHTHTLITVAMMISMIYTQQLKTKSVQLTSFDRLGYRGNMRSDSTETLLLSFLQQAVVISSDWVGKSTL